jgi:gluconate 5-dehydrogenase
VIVNGVDERRLADTTDAMRGAGRDVRAARFDVTAEREVARAFERFDTEGMAIDIIVNNAGIQLRRPIIEFSADEWRKIIDANLTSAFLVGREAARRMIPRRRGKIINIGSVTSEVARPTIAPYAASKGAIKLLTRAMAAEWAPHGIQANAIGPGYMLTDMNQALIADEAFNAWVTSRAPARRWGKPQELVGAAIFLASAASDYVNGQIIYVDGGMLAVM